MLVLAGPGSGKTTVISERVRYLIEEKGVEPGRILTITFTKAAAREMQGRCQRICPRAGSAVFGTFHSVFYHFLHKSEKYQNFTLINEKEKKEMMQKIIPVGSMTTLQHLFMCENMLKKISFLKNSGSEPAEDEQVLAQTMERYCRLCKEQEKLDFDDMLLLCHRLFTEHKGELAKWQRRFQYILVDEFQDINRCQYEIVKLLAAEHGNLFVVGDDDQAIYSFRGSDPGFIKQFTEDFADCRQICLEENYRSGAAIVTAAGKSIGQNAHRFAKHIRAMGCFENHVSIKRYDSAADEAGAIALEVAGLMAQAAKVSDGSIAVLVRTNAQAEYLAEQFFQKEIPCSFRERRTCFYEHPWVADILAVLRFAACGQKRSDFLMFMNKPFRGLERAMLADERVNPAAVADMLTARGEWALAKEVRALERTLRLMQGMDPYGAVKLILHGLKYRAYLEGISGADESAKQQIEEVTQELLARAGGFESIAQFLSFVNIYTEHFHMEEAGTTAQRTSAAQQTSAAQRTATAQQSERGEGVQILTYHASKGLEFDSVFLPMLKEGIVPHGRMLTQQQTEEERRMFYVAMTRAKRRLFLSWSGKADGTGASLFLKELEAAEIGT